MLALATRVRHHFQLQARRRWTTPRAGDLMTCQFCILCRTLAATWPERRLTGRWWWCWWWWGGAVKSCRTVASATSLGPQHVWFRWWWWQEAAGGGLRWRGGAIILGLINKDYGSARLQSKQQWWCMLGLLMGRRWGASVSGGQVVTPTLITALSHSVVPSVQVPLRLWLGHAHCA